LCDMTWPEMINDPKSRLAPQTISFKMGSKLCVEMCRGKCQFSFDSVLCKCWCILKWCEPYCPDPNISENKPKSCQKTRCQKRSMNTIKITQLNELNTFHQDLLFDFRSNNYYVLHAWSINFYNTTSLTKSNC
jgi:hypothetical protein